MVSITRPQVIDVLTEHLETIEPIDGAALRSAIKSDRRPNETTIRDGQVIKRMVFHPKRRGSTWIVSVWPTYRLWMRDAKCQWFKVEWPGEVTPIKRRGRSFKTQNHPTRDKKNVSYSLHPWWWEQMAIIGERWFKSRVLSHLTKHMVRLQTLTELARHQTENPALYARPCKRWVGNTLTVWWEIINPVDESMMGSGQHEVDAWEACCRKLDIEWERDRLKVWRAPDRWDNIP